MNEDELEQHLYDEYEAWESRQASQGWRWWPPSQQPRGYWVMHPAWRNEILKMQHASGWLQRYDMEPLRPAAEFLLGIPVLVDTRYGLPRITSTPQEPEPTVRFRFTEVS